MEEGGGRGEKRRGRRRGEELNRKIRQNCMDAVGIEKILLGEKTFKYLALEHKDIGGTLQQALTLGK